MGGWVGGVEKLILKLTSASTGVEVEARAELGKKHGLKIPSVSWHQSCHPAQRKSLVTTNHISSHEAESRQLSNH